MTFHELRSTLSANPDAAIVLTLPDGQQVPPHFHITEVGKIQKEFIDCGGIVGTSSACVLQAWVANDDEHRLSASRLAGIMSLAFPIIKNGELPVEVEYDAGVISQYPISCFNATAGLIEIQLSAKHTACLALDRCGLNIIETDDCSSSGCC